MMQGVQPQVKAPVLFGTAKKQEANGPSRLITVTGNGKVSKDPDTMTIVLSRTEQGKDKQGVFKALTDFGKKVTDALKKLKLPIQFQGVRNGPYLNREWQDNKLVTKGYKGEFQVVVTEQNGKPEDFANHAAQIDEVAYETGAEFNGPHFAITNRDEAKKEADKKAIRNALESAKNYASELGFEIDEVPVAVTDKQDGGGMAYADSSERAYFAAAAPKGGGRNNYQSSGDLYQAKPIDVHGTPVTVQFKITGKKAQ